MNVVDSSAWLEYFANGPNAAAFAPPILDVRNLVVPSLCLLEVFKRALQQRGEDQALQAVAVMHQGRVVDLSSDIALHSARLSHRHKLALADSVVLATAQRHHAVLWTQDADLKDMPNVRYFAKKPP